VTGKTFDNGVLCSSKFVVSRRVVAEAVKREFQAQGGYFMSRAEMDARLAGARHVPAAPESRTGRQERDRYCR